MAKVEQTFQCRECHRHVLRIEAPAHLIDACRYENTHFVICKACKHEVEAELTSPLDRTKELPIDLTRARVRA